MFSFKAANPRIREIVYKSTLEFCERRIQEAESRNLRFPHLPFFMGAKLREKLKILFLKQKSYKYNNNDAIIELD
jgi:hypothetical protein